MKRSEIEALVNEANTWLGYNEYDLPERMAKNLVAAAIHLLEQTRWRKTSEELPHDVGCSGPYMVWYQEQEELLPISSGIGLCHYDARERPPWSSNLGLHVTHWLPLPQPPEEE